MRFLTGRKRSRFSAEFKARVVRAADSLLPLQSPCGLTAQQQRQRYPWERFHLITGKNLSSAWGQVEILL